MVLNEKIKDYLTNRTTYSTMLLTLLASTLLTGTVAASGGPADAIVNAMSSVLGQVAIIGAVLLAGYGFYQMIMVGIKDQKSGPLKKAAVAWVLAIAVARWENIVGFFSPDSVSIGNGDSSDDSTTTTETIDGLDTESLLQIQNHIQAEFIDVISYMQSATINEYAALTVGIVTITGAAVYMAKYSETSIPTTLKTPAGE